VAAGSEHSLFITSDGSLWGMGVNDYGQLGEARGVTFHLTPFRIVPSPPRITGLQIYYSSVILTGSNGELGETILCLKEHRPDAALESVEAGRSQRPECQ
jgi:hypothetical protein